MSIFIFSKVYYAELRVYSGELRVCLVARVGYLTSTKLGSAMPTSHKYVLLCVFGRLYYLSIAWLR
jgi:hypothetical protein